MNIELYRHFLEPMFDVLIVEQKELDDTIYIKSGELIRRNDGKRFEIKNYIPRFVKDDSYSESFGYQWSKFRDLQHDSHNGKGHTEKRLLINTRWKKEELKEKVILECGCGPGRFTELFCNWGGYVIAVDMSGAIDVNLDNLGLQPNVLYIQDDIMNLYYMKEIADYVFCYGVLQHTPKPHKTLHRLGKYAKFGGKISMDIYLKRTYLDPFSAPKYFWRPITRKMDRKKLLKILQWYIPKYIKFDTKIRPLCWKEKPIGKTILGFIPVPCYNYLGMGYSDEERVQHAIMDTFDALSPQYDNPCSFEELSKWAGQERYKQYTVREGSTGLVLNAIR